ncbi:hypothetical protein FSP39_008763 [Pinctada imbricata]|uniref:Uncharacterized protein n=1 Tax=Pinctada imbricata TaxID=66713 RepID=A0AA89BUM3_PINIB|nr:hypothetical protein FSP39_008763 [Pinctada imbricata]
MALQFIILFIHLIPATEAFSLQRFNCSYQNNDTECQVLFQQLASDSKTKMIYIHLNNHNASSQQDEIFGVIPDKEEPKPTTFVWVNKSSEHMMTFPEDFHSLTFGLLADNIYELNINMSTELNVLVNMSTVTNETNKFLFSRLILNISVGLLCEEDTKDVHFQYLYELSVFRPENDYLCLTTYDKVGRRISRNSMPFIIISVVCILCILWFPMLFALTDQNKYQLKRQRPNRFLNMPSLLNSMCGYMRDEDDSLTTSKSYDPSEVPYGPQRIFIALFHRNYTKEYGMATIHLNFTIFIVLVISVPSYILIIFNKEFMQISFGIRGYSSLTHIIGIFISSLWFVILFGFAMPLCCKNYTYCFDLHAFLKGKKCAKKISFSEILKEIPESNYFHNMINRQLIVFHPKLWYWVIKMTFSETKYKAWNECKKGILIIPCVLCNILLQIIWTLPSVWYLFDFFFIIMSKLIFKIKCKRNCLKIIRILLATFFASILISISFLFLFLRWSILAVIPLVIKVFCYTFFIALPFTNIDNVGMIISYTVLITYWIRLYTTLIGLYHELLKIIFKLHEESKMQLNVNFVAIAEFDFVADHVFPFREQLFYIVSKIFLTGICFLITVTQSTTYKQTDGLLQFDSLTSFIFIILFPTITAIVSSTSNEQKVILMKEEIRKWSEKWYTEIDSIENENHRRLSISNISNKEESMSNISNNEESMSNISNKEESMSNISNKEESMSSISNKEESMSNISNKEESMSNISNKEESMSSISNKEESMSNISNKEESMSNISNKEESMSSISYKEESMSNISNKEESMSSISNKEESMSSISNKEEDASIIHDATNDMVLKHE